MRKKILVLSTACVLILASAASQAMLCEKCPNSFHCETNSAGLSFDWEGIVITGSPGSWGTANFINYRRYDCPSFGTNWVWIGVHIEIVEETFVTEGRTVSCGVLN